MVSPDTLTPALLSTTYFGPIQWYQKLHRHKPCLIERHESFIKQTYRNRMVIATANGAQPLSIPVTHDDSMLITDIRISDHANWRHVHWNALASAYGESAFFEYYQDDIRPFFEQKWEFLYDFNEAIMYKMIELLDLRVDVGATESYIKTETHDNADAIGDYRESIRPKKPLPDAAFCPQRYYQVYAQRHGFIPNLSILDLLFNQGNESILYL